MLIAGTERLAGKGEFVVDGQDNATERGTQARHRPDPGDSEARARRPWYSQVYHHLVRAGPVFQRREETNRQRHAAT